MNQDYSAIAQRSPSALATSKVLRNTYMLLSLTLLFSGFTAAISMAMNMPRVWTRTDAKHVCCSA